VEQVVGECSLKYEPDILDGYECCTLELAPEKDGALTATLIRRAQPIDRNRKAVLYVHGFVDYFFQTHLANAIEDAGYQFYALDLRRYGRSLREGNRANQATSIEDYFEEIEWALSSIRKEHPGVRAVIGHSTGALILAHYLRGRSGPATPERFVMNSPFLRFNLGWFDEQQAKIVSALARFTPYLPLPRKLPGIYGTTLHSSRQGEWNFDEALKPHRGFPLFPAWFRMIREAHAGVRQGLNLSLPILSLRSDRSHMPSNEPVDIDFESDVVLNVEHMRELSPLLGDNVTMKVIPGGLHDLTLSRLAARTHAIQSVVDFLQTETPGA